MMASPLLPLLGYRQSGVQEGSNVIESIVQEQTVEQ
jgi:hypothetical protein